MLGNVIKKVFGTKNERELKRFHPRVDAIAALEPSIQALSDDQLRAKTAEFKQRIENGESLDDLLHEAFAVCREASWRVMEMRHFDVQMIGGMVLHEGKIAEMRTGEGKTLVATLATYLNALSGKGVHVVTVNDYLAKRDAEWMGQLYNWLGLSVGVIVHGKTDRERQEAYRSDITYGQNNEFGFDYLRDNMKFAMSNYVQRPLSYAIVDEVDSILIDEARTPLIISGPAEASSDKYTSVNAIVPKLRKDADYVVDEKSRTVSLTDEGVTNVERLLHVDNLYNPVNIEFLHHVNQALRAHTLYKREDHYVVKDGKVVIVDEFTGRQMDGRRWSDGLHQAVEAKEGVTIENENQTLATISFQNYFRLYDKLSGMTGTAETEAEEFGKIYELDVVVVPTNRPIARRDYEDVVYRTEREKYMAVVDEIAAYREAGKPILVGTVSIEKSELIARMLKKKGVPHEVLNAKQHQREATIVAQAGQPGAVTIATNMAGRGTDIVLGGNAEKIVEDVEVPDETEEEREERLEKMVEECVQARDEVIAEKTVEAQDEDGKAVQITVPGGLHIIGTERHEARRIDNQLRGRSGRQGDPGSTRFFLSLEDDLMRRFGSDRISGLMQKLGMEEGIPIEHKWVTKSIEGAQRRVEGQNFDIRKHLLEYDDVMNVQRKTIYTLRRAVLMGEVVDRLQHAVRPPEPEELEEMEAQGQTWEPLVDLEIALAIVGNSDETLRARVVDLYGDREQVHQDELAEIAKTAGHDTHELVLDLVDETVAELVEQYCPPNAHAEDWDLFGLNEAALEVFAVRPFEPLVQINRNEPILEELASDLEKNGHVADARHLKAALQRKREELERLEAEESVEGDITRVEEINKEIEGIDRARGEIREDVDLPEGFDLTIEGVENHIFGVAEKRFHEKEEELGLLLLRQTERYFYLQTIDTRWKEHLQGMDQLREGIGLRGYAQKDPKQEYKKEGYELFVETMRSIKTETLSRLSRVVIEREEQVQQPVRKAPKLILNRGADGEDDPKAAAEAKKTVKRERPKIGRNDPCWCGSGKKYKRCHGAPGAQATA